MGISDEALASQTGLVAGPGGFSAGQKAGGAAPAAAAAPVEEKTSFDLKLGAVDAKAKIKIIKEVRTVTGLGLKEVCESYMYIFVQMYDFIVRQRIWWKRHLASSNKD